MKTTTDPRCGWLDEAEAGLRLDLGPLDTAAVQALVASHLPVAPDLGDRLAARAAGNPGEAIRLVRRLAEDRQLVAHPDGWRLRPGADLDAVSAGEEARIRARVAALRATDLRALEVLVERGPGPVAAWEEAAVAAGVSDVAGALDRLAREGLLTVNAVGVEAEEHVERIVAG